MSALKKKIIFHNISNFLEKNLLVFFFNYNHINTEEWHVIKEQLSKITQVNTLVVKNRIGKNVITKKNSCKKGEEGAKENSSFKISDFNSLLGAHSGKENSIFKISDFNSLLSSLEAHTDNSMLLKSPILTTLKKKKTAVCAPWLVKNPFFKNIRDEKIDKIEKLSTLFQGPTFLIGIASAQECEPVFTIIKKQKKCIFVGGLYQGQLINHLDVEYLLKVEKVAYTDLISTLQSPLYFTPITTNRMQLYYLLKCYQDIKERVSK